jgi:hypothetical protein
MTPHFGRALQAAGKQREPSQDQLAIAASLHRTHISLPESGLRVSRAWTRWPSSAGLLASRHDVTARNAITHREHSHGCFKTRAERTAGDIRW